MTTTKTRKYGGAAALLAAGLVAGGVLAGTLTADAADTSTPSSSASSSADPGRQAEAALTGDKLAKVKAAVLEEYRNATFVRVETDSDGVYEAHISKTDGTEATVELDAGYAITGEEAGHGGHGGPGGRGGHDGGTGETALTGDTLAKVKAAVSAAHPNATFVRVETDSDGAYEAHITKTDGTQVTVEVNTSFAVTGEE